MRSLNVEDVPSSSPPPAPSRFLTLEEITHIPAGKVEGRVTLNAFLVPHKGDLSTTNPWYKSLRAVFDRFQPRGFEFIEWKIKPGWERFTMTWFWALAEDGWVESKFGKLEPSQGDTQQGRTVICEFHLWSRESGVAPEYEEASATDPQAKESWNEAVAQVIPPVTAWVQERWDISKMPLFRSLSEEPEDVEYERGLQEDLGEDYLSPAQRKAGLIGDY